jgi:hypothetical protein
MATYKVTVNLNSITYDIESENEDKAIEIARDNVTEESHYDILKWADYEVEEVKK